VDEFRERERDRERERGVENEEMVIEREKKVLEVCYKL